MTIQETNIERVLHDHLWQEIRLLGNKINELESEAQTLAEREAMLRNVAIAAGIEDPQNPQIIKPLYEPDPRD